MNVDKYKVIAFDLDGTLIDSIHDIAFSMNCVLEDNNLPTHTVEKYKDFIGAGAYELVKQACNDHKDVDSFFEQYKKYALNNCTTNANEFYNVSKTLLSLQHKYKLALISNKPMDQALKAVEFYFPNMFEYVFGQQKGIEKKPNIEPMSLLLKHFNVSNQEVLYVGDSHVDYEFANNAKVDVLILTYGYAQQKFLDSLDENVKINNFDEILNKI